MFYADSTGLASYDGTHFDSESLFRLGAERYFGAYREATGDADSVFAHVNKGGVPGVAGSGDNEKIYNLKPLRDFGLGVKGPTLPPALAAGLTGTPAELNALMLAAGAVVRYGVDDAGTWYWRFESGLQVAFNSRFPLAYQSSAVLSGTLNFALSFVGGLVAAVPTMILNGSVNMGPGKRTGTHFEQTSGSSLINLSLRSASSAFTGGDELIHVSIVVVGLWKYPW